MTKGETSIGVVILSFLNPIVGAGEYARSIVKLLSKKFEITVYTYEGTAREEFKSTKNIKFITVEPPKRGIFYYLDSVKKLFELFIKIKKHDIILYAGGLEAYLTHFVKLKTPKLKSVSEFHHMRGGLSFFNQLKVNGLLLGLVEYVSVLLTKESDSIITSSETWKKLLKEGGYNKPVYVAYNSVEPCKRGDLKLKITHPIIYTGLCQPIHNIELSIKALPLIKREYPSASLLITGRKDDVYFKKLLEIARELGVNNDVHYLGILSDEDVRSVYEQSDVVFFVTKDPYGWSRVLLKGILYKTPCIAMGVGALTELIHRYGGILIEDDPKEFSEAVIKLVKYKKDVKRVKERAYRSLQKDTWEVATEIHERCIRNLLNS